MAHSIAEHSKLVPVSVVLLAALGAAGSSVSFARVMGPPFSHGVGTTCLAQRG
jgi:hypothetical protein